MIVLTSGERAWLRHGRQLRIAHLVWRKQVHRLLAQVVNEVGLHTLVPTSTRVDRIMRLCADAECHWCSQIICPYDDLMHFHHDGCPACAEAVVSGMKGQHGPNILKCSKCKLQRDAQGRARTGGLVRAVGWSDRTVRRRRGICTAYALYCMSCGHVGWYTHRRAASLASKGKQ